MKTWKNFCYWHGLCYDNVRTLWWRYHRSTMLYYVICSPFSRYSKFLCFDLKISNQILISLNACGKRHNSTFYICKKWICFYKCTSELGMKAALTHHNVMSLHQSTYCWLPRPCFLSLNRIYTIHLLLSLVLNVVSVVADSATFSF
jgi:hypothetical protein